MAVWVRQLTELEETDNRPLPTPDGMTDSEFLQVKYDSHNQKGWVVTPIDVRSFTATKTRRTNIVCERRFWIE